MRKRQLEMALSRAGDIEDPDPRWEQYRTPPDIVTDILWMAMENEDIENRNILELGCGGAPFALGALMLGASRITGFDIDPRALDLARANMKMFINEDLIEDEGSATFLQGDVSTSDLPNEGFDTIFMNPPFGAQNKHADRPFIEAACRTGRTVYSIHNGGTERFVIKQFEERGFVVNDVLLASMKIPHRFHFHRKSGISIKVLIIHSCRILG